MPMSKNIFSGDLSRLNAKEKERIRDALHLLINIFWSGGGRKDWAELWNKSPAVWSGLQHTVFVRPPRIVNYVRESQAQNQACPQHQALESEFVRIFVNTWGGVSAPLYHSFYSGDQRILMQEPVLIMHERLENAGLAPRSQGEPVDHLCMELEYLYFLLGLERQDQNNELLRETSGFAGSFMLPWVSEFYRRIPDTGPSAFFALTAGAMKDLIYFLGRPVP